MDSIFQTCKSFVHFLQELFLTIFLSVFIFCLVRFSLLVLKTVKSFILVSLISASSPSSLVSWCIISSLNVFWCAKKANLFLKLITLTSFSLQSKIFHHRLKWIYLTQLWTILFTTLLLSYRKCPALCLLCQVVFCLTFLYS